MKQRKKKKKRVHQYLNLLICESPLTSCPISDLLTLLNGRLLPLPTFTATHPIIPNQSLPKHTTHTFILRMTQQLNEESPYSLPQWRNLKNLRSIWKGLRHGAIVVGLSRSSLLPSGPLPFLPYLPRLCLLSGSRTLSNRICWVDRVYSGRVQSKRRNR
jgi:hypothetical protein